MFVFALYQSEITYKILQAKIQIRIIHTLKRRRPIPLTVELFS